MAAVFSLGTRAGGCLYALGEILREEPEVPEVYFLYGEPAPGQKESPIEAVAEIRAHPEFAHVPVIAARGANAFSFEHSYASALELMREIAGRGYERVYLGIVGGTNPLVTAVFHAGMAELPGEVIPVYVVGRPGAAGEQSVEMPRWTKARDRIAADRVLRRARDGQLAAAAVLAADLPGRGRAGFVRDSVLALSSWDNFDYSVADRFAALAQRAEDYETDRDLGGLCRTLARYGARAKGMADLERLFADVQAFRAAAKDPRGLDARVEQRGAWLVADALANAKRRLAEGRFTDSVLRSYRAVEVAVQYRLFRLGVHPGDLRWDEAPLAAVAEKWRSRQGEPGKTVSLESGVGLLELVSGEDFGDTLRVRREIQNVRNQSYLEHGYQRVSQKAAESTMGKAGEVSARVTGKDVVGLAGELEMEF